MQTRNSKLGMRNSRRASPAAAFARRSQRRVPVTGRAAFTLIELIVVVTILVILVGMITVVATRTIEGARERQTRVTLELLNTALQEFANSNPLRGWTYASGAFGYVGAGLHDAYRRDFGPFPPHYDWYAQAAGVGDGVREWTLAESPAPSVVLGNINDSRVKLFRNPNLSGFPTIVPNFFSGVRPTYNPDIALNRHHGAGEYGDTQALNLERRDLENSESLYFWLTQLCPEAKPVLDRLPSGAITNTDVYARIPDAPKVAPLPDFIDHFGNSPGIVTDDEELFEIRDAWGNVISYWVYFIDEIDPAWRNGKYDGRPTGPSPIEKYMTPIAVLESAGPDGKFGHRPGMGIKDSESEPSLRDETALGDNLFSEPPPWPAR